MESTSQNYPNDSDSPLAALGLQRVGEEKPPTNVEPNVHLNRRGMPARIRKKNKIYFDDDIVTSPSKVKTPKKASRMSSPKKSQKPIAPPLSPSPPSSPNILTPPSPMYQTVKCGVSPKLREPKSDPADVMASPDRLIAQDNGFRLRNFLKLPQAHKWVFFEWFYSNIDKPLFDGENDFQIVLKETFPQLTGRLLSRRQWGLIRKMMGKPRRCSQAFFEEERQSLAKRRQVLRLLQQRKLTDLSSLKDLPLPSHISMPLVVGTKVTARLRKPENGLYTGIIDAVDTSDNTYRITFDRNGVGTHSIPDYEVLSSEGNDMMPLSAYTRQFRPRVQFGLFTPPRPILPKVDPGDLLAMDSPGGSLANDPILAQSPSKPSAARFTVNDTIGGFPVQSLIVIVSLSKILKAKREKLDSLKSLNEQAEMTRSFGQELTLDFQRRYASIVLDMENVNRELNQKLLKVQQFCQDIAPDIGLSGPTLLPSQIRERSYEEAAAVVDLTNLSSGNEQVGSPAVLDLITKLTSIMLQLKNITENEVSALELNSLQETMAEIRDGLDQSNRMDFENNVEVHLRHIISAVTQVGTLQGFNSS